MNFLRLLPVFISFLMLAAHFFRAGQTPIVILLMSTLFLLLVRRNWVPWLIQLILVLAAVEWLRTLFVIAQVRIHMGEPWIRMAMILGAVALLTVLSGLVFRTAALQAWYSESRTSTQP